MLDEFAAWYVAQWRDLIPERWRGAGAERATILFAEPDNLEAPTRFALTLREGAGREQPLGTLDAARPAAPLLANRARPRLVVLRVPAGTILGRDVTLPLAAERDLATVLNYEMDRLTPFAAAELRWGTAIRARDRAGNRLHLRLSLVGRDRVEPALAALAAYGLRADAIEGADGAGMQARIALAAAEGARRLRREHALLIGAWSAVAVLAVVAVGLPFVRAEWAGRAATHRIEALRPAVRQADNIRAHLDSATAGADVIAAARHQTGDVLATLASLTDALPDDTFLTDLTMTGGKVTINGQSASAAKLIGLLSANPDWRNPTFAAPVTRLESARTDLFSIRAERAGDAR